MSYSQLLTFGSIAKDELMTHPGIFQDHIDKDNLEDLNVFFIIDDLKIELGGIATNISYNFNLLSDKTNYILGGIGLDGKVFEDFFKFHKINTDYLKRSSELYSGTFKGIASIDQNQIGAFYYGANLAAKEIVLSEIPDYQNSLLILSSSHPEAVKEILNQAIELNQDYVFDPGMMLTWIDNQSLFKGVKSSKYLISNNYEINLLLKRLKLEIQDIVNSGTSLIVTKGKNGVDYYDKNKSLQLPAVSISRFVDPTGVGDAFRGGFFAGILENKSLEDSLIQGSVMGSFAVESRGGVNHKLDQKLFEERFNTLKNSLTVG